MMALKQFATSRPVWTILSLAALILLSEGVIMVLLGEGHRLTWESSLRIAALDAGALALLLVPFIYLVFIKPARLLEERYRVLVESVPDAIFHLDQDGTILFVNSRMEVLTGFARDELVGKAYLDVVSPQAQPELLQAFARLRDGETLRGEASILQTNGNEQVFVEFSAVPRLVQGRFRGAVGILRDVTEMKRADAALAESEQQYRRLFEGNPQPMWVYDVETLGFLAVNDAAVSHYGYSREEFRGLTIKDIRPAEDVPQLLGKVSRRERGPGRSSGVRHRRKDGTIIFVDVTSYPLVFSGRPARIVLANDVTERKRLEEQLRHAQKMEAVGQLAGGVAHDFNNLLTVIVMYASLLQEDLKGNAVWLGYVDQVLKSADRAAHLTRSLLTFSRKRVVSKYLPTDLNEVIQGIARLLLRVLGEQIEIRTHLRGQKLVVMADASQLEQVIMNLCTNARDAMPRGGILTIETAAEEVGSDFIASHGFGAAGPYAAVTVSDTGEGMPEETRQRIFEPFFTTKEVGRGTGLGLAIVYGIVKQHEGFIDVSSQPGVGTVFKILLPLVARDALASPAAPQPAPPAGEELVLLAEDEEDVRRITRAVLEGHGYRVIEAVDGEEAVRKFRESRERISLFFSDNIMPKKSGRDAFEEMRRLDPELKVLFTSGYTVDFLEQEGIPGGASRLLPKPASPSDILRRIREVLDGK